MPYEIDINTKTPQVKLLSSTLIELFSVVQLLAIPSHHEKMKEFAENTIKHLSNESLLLLDDIAKFHFHGLELFDLVLDIFVLDDVPLFVNKLNEYTSEKFIAVITMDRLTDIQIKQIINRELDNHEIEKLLPWFFKESIEEFGPLLFHPKQFIKRLSRLLLDIYESPYFLPQMEANRFKYEDTLKNLEKELRTKTPLELGQQIMNKTFKNVFDYKLYIFCPTYFIIPHRLRVHHNTINFIIFGLNQDHLYVNQALEKITSTLKVISDQTRLEILRKLSIKPTYGKVLASSLDLTTATISHHLDLLKSIGLIKEEKVKNIKYFHVNKDEVDNILRLTENYIKNDL